MSEETGIIQTLFSVLKGLNQVVGAWLLLEKGHCLSHHAEIKNSWVLFGF